MSPQTGTVSAQKNALKQQARGLRWVGFGVQVCRGARCSAPGSRHRPAARPETWYTGGSIRGDNSLSGLQRCKAPETLGPLPVNPSLVIRGARCRQVTAVQRFLPLNKMILEEMRAVKAVNLTKQAAPEGSRWGNQCFPGANTEQQSKKRCRMADFIFVTPAGASGQSAHALTQQTPLRTQAKDRNHSQGISLTAQPPPCTPFLRARASSSRR